MIKSKKKKRKQKTIDLQSDYIFMYTLYTLILLYVLIIIIITSFKFHYTTLQFQIHSLLFLRLCNMFKIGSSLFFVWNVRNKFSDFSYFHQNFFILFIFWFLYPLTCEFPRSSLFSSVDLECISNVCATNLFMRKIRIESNRFPFSFHKKNSEQQEKFYSIWIYARWFSFYTNCINSHEKI